jgi:hypothetical protein
MRTRDPGGSTRVDRGNWTTVEESVMPSGTIKKVQTDRGFGFITAEDGQEYFFHRTGLDSSLNFDALRGSE